MIYVENIKNVRCKINLTSQSQKPPNLKVVKMVLNTHYYQYLWLTM